MGSLIWYFTTNTQAESSIEDLVSEEQERFRFDKEEQGGDLIWTDNEVNDLQRVTEDGMKEQYETGSEGPNGEDIQNDPEVNIEDSNEQLVFPLNIDDPGNWNNIDHNFRDILIERGPKRIEDYPFPKDNLSRHSTSASYIQKLSNREEQ